MNQMLVKVFAALMLFVTLLAFAGEPYWYATRIIWKVLPDSTTQYIGAFTFSDEDEACKNSEYQFVKWVNKYKAFEGDEDCDSLIVYLALFSFDSTNTVCATSDTILCNTVDFQNTYGGSGYVPME